MTNWRDDAGRESDSAPQIPTGENFTVMTRRDRFAMAALQGLLSQPNIKFDSPTTAQQIREAYADAATASADALIAALDKVRR